MQYDLDADARLRLGMRVNQARREQGLTFLALAEKSGYDERTIRNLVQGQSTRSSTLNDVCACLGVSLVEAREERCHDASDDAVGGYTYSQYDEYIGNYFGYRRSFSDRSNIMRSAFDIRWCDDAKCFLFSENNRYCDGRGRIIDHSQSGHIYVSAKIDLFNMVTIFEGSVRLISLSKMCFDDSSMSGMVLTPSRQRGHYYPAASAFLLRKSSLTVEEMINRIGPMRPDCVEFNEINAALSDIENNGAIIAVGSPEGSTSNLRLVGAG